MKSLISKNLALATFVLVPTAALATGIPDFSLASASRSHPSVAGAVSRGAAENTAMAQSLSTIRVIVTLKGLEAGPAWAERIARARERVMLALKNHHVEINREYDLIPALALTVDNEALRILRSHPDVAGVAEDGASTPGSGAGPTGPAE